MGVAISPGATALTRMPCSASSKAITLVSSPRPPFAAQYALEPFSGTCSWTEVTLTIRPPRPPATIRRAASCAHTNAPVRSTSSTWRHLASSTSRNAVESPVPALLTNASRPPSASASDPTTPAPVDASPRSRCATSARRPAARTSSAVPAAPASSLCQVRPTSKPCWASRTAVALPMPESPAVTIALGMPTRCPPRAGENRPPGDSSRPHRPLGDQAFSDRCGRIRTDDLHDEGGVRRTAPRRAGPPARRRGRGGERAGSGLAEGDRRGRGTAARLLGAHRRAAQEGRPRRVHPRRARRLPPHARPGGDPHGRGRPRPRGRRRPDDLLRRRGRRAGQRLGLPRRLQPRGRQRPRLRHQAAVDARPRRRRQGAGRHDAGRARRLLQPHPRHPPGARPRRGGLNPRPRKATNTTTMADLEIRNLHVQAGDKEILRGVDLTVNKGEIHALMGPNGSGKSTLANAIMGHPGLEITEGQILFQGEDITESDPDERARAGLFMAFQYPVAIPGVTMTKYLRMVLNAHREAKGEPEISLKDFRKTVEAAMELTNVPKEFASRYLNDGFSGGEKKRLETLQLALQKPAMAILDETDSGLDIDALNVVAHGVNTIAKGSDMGVLIITHYQRILHLVEPQRVSIMFNGRIIKEGGPELVTQLEREGYAIIKEEAGVGA